MLYFCVHFRSRNIRLLYSLRAGLLDYFLMSVLFCVLRDSFVGLQHDFLSVHLQTTVLMELTVAGEALLILPIKIYLLRDVSMTGRNVLFVFFFFAFV